MRLKAWLQIGILIVAFSPIVALAILSQRSIPPGSQPAAAGLSAAQQEAPSAAAQPATKPRAKPSPPVPLPSTTAQSPARGPSVRPSDPTPSPSVRRPADLPPVPSTIARKNRKLRGAVLADSHSELQTLLESRILGDTRVDWVERAEIDKVLKEHSLQAMFAAEAVANRSAVGRLLNADLLVVTRQVKKEQGSFLELIVCETSQGLRLCSQALPIQDSSDTTLASAMSLIGQAFEKCGEEIAEIWAVPPFVSDNLTNKHGSLKCAYARLIEQDLLRQRGILVVELAEARSIAKEAQLTKENTVIVRRMPLYVLGRFRHESRDGRELVCFRIALTRGEQTVREVAPQSVPAEEAGSYLGRAAAELCEASRGTPSVRPDPEVEARQLADRAGTFARLGEWDEALALCDASLLLRPRDPATQWAAFQASLQLAKLAYEDMRKDWSEPQLAVPFFEYHRQVWHHSVEIVRYEPQLNQMHGKLLFALHFADVAVTPPYNRLLPEATTQLFSEATRIRCDSLVEITRHAVARQAKAPHLQDFAAAIVRSVGRHMDKPPQASWPTRLRAIESIAESPEFRTYALELTCDAKYDLEVEPTIAKLAASSHLSLQRLAKDLRKRHGLDVMSPKELAKRDARLRKTQEDAEATLRRPPGREPKSSDAHGNLLSPDSSSGKPIQVVSEEPDVPPSPPALPPEFTSRGVVFRPIWFYEKVRTYLTPQIHQIVPMAPGVDLVRQGSSLYLMTKKGRLDFLGKCLHIPNVQFDGRFLWISTVASHKNPCLVVFDPQTRLAWTIGKADGLPFPESTEKALDGRGFRYCMAGTLGPGKVCVVGSFGRTWIGLLHFDPRSGVKFELVHEARTVPEIDEVYFSKDLWKDPSAGFVPLWITSLTTPASSNAAEKRIALVFRSGSPFLVSHPLVVDVERRSCRLLESPLPCMNVVLSPITSDLLRNYAEADGVFYAADPVDGLRRFRPTDFQSEILVPQPMLGCLLCRKDQFHVAGSKWWSGSLSQRRILVEAETPWLVRPAFTHPDPANKMPYLNQLCTSEHYGLVAICDDNTRDSCLFYQVEVPEGPKLP